jgi:hypothetical protein
MIYEPKSDNFHQQKLVGCCITPEFLFKLRKRLEILKSVKLVADLCSCSLHSTFTLPPTLYRVLHEKPALIRANVP